MESQDTQLLRRLLDARPVAALATLHRGEPALSMVPFVLRAGTSEQSGDVLIHVSALATHTADMLAHARVSLMVMDEPAPGTLPQALPRVVLSADARAMARDDDAYPAAKAAYLARFPDSAMTFELADFSIFVLRPLAARRVAGFGSADSIVGDKLAAWLRG